MNQESPPYSLSGNVGDGNCHREPGRAVNDSEHIAASVGLLQGADEIDVDGGESSLRNWYGFDWRLHVSLYLPSLAPQTGLCPLLDVLLHGGPQIARRCQSHRRLGPWVRGIMKIFIDLSSELPRDEDAGKPGG